MKKRLYEAMFLVDATVGESGLPDAVSHIAELIGRFDGEVERIEKWSERELAYPIGGINTGIYLLVFFRADTDKLSDIRRVLNISERITRFIILQAESVPPVSGIVYGEDGQEIEVQEPAAGAKGGTGDEGDPSEEEVPDAEEEGENVLSAGGDV